MVISSAYAIVAEIYFDDCGLSEAQAKDAVIKELDLRRLDKRFLSASAAQKGSCSYSFDFEGQGQKLNYIVMSTWLQGVKVNFWDYKREELEDADSKFQKKPYNAASNPH